MHSYSWSKSLLRPLVPGLLLRARQRWRNRRREAYAARLWAATGGRVFSGPFTGMSYIRGVTGSALGPKLLGSYEQELHGVIGEIVAAGFDPVIHVGAAEGYYAVGLLTRMPGGLAWAFESEPDGQRQLRELAALNGVSERLTVAGTCAPADLARALPADGPPPLVVMDVEGAEAELLDPGACPALRRAAILVELHEHLRPGVTDRLLGWYSQTHRVRRIPTVAGNRVALPTPPGLSRRQNRLLADEMRSARMEWMYLVPRAAAGGEA
jgi:hypothetical protein